MSAVASAIVFILKKKKCEYAIVDNNQFSKLKKIVLDL